MHLIPSSYCYYTLSKTEGLHQAHAKGKLVEKWKNVSKRLRAVGALEVQTKIVDSSLESHNINVFTVNLAKEWLKTDGLIASFDDILKNWNITFELRNSEITNSINNCNLLDFFESWPILQGPRVEIDFRLKYPNDMSYDFSHFINNWTKFTKAILNIRRSSIKDKHANNLLSQYDAAQLMKDYRTCNILKLLLLPYLIPTKTQIKGNNKNKSWKPSLEESAAAFVTHITVITIPNVKINSTSSKSTLLNPESLISHTEIENKINNSFENIVTNSAVSFIADLYSNPSTNELISNGIICHLKSKIEPLLDKCTSEQIQEIDKLIP
ncbi:hypothetical protein AGLY_015134 [Aphis glycines]|uniref:Uncharacterized protein n=1 Tax=Aphis glycines TaxID=307491 RepID=A0A6G0T1A4_APHGL|nr:hypothetical protein AGLY_015134 [Aphis glycines]